MSRRTVTVPVGHISIEKGWSSSKLTISSGDKKAVIEIKDPWDLNFLRLRLTEIEEYWKARMAELSS